MRADRYLKFILTLIACELLWLGLKGGATPVTAQQEPMPVVVTGFRIGSTVYTTLPVGVVGAWPGVSGERSPSGPSRPVKVDAGTVSIVASAALPVQQPLVVQTGRDPLVVQTGERPLRVESVQAQGSQRPGH